MPVKNVKELNALARSKPNEIVFSSSGPYGITHTPMAMYMDATGVKMRHLPTTGGGPALAAVLGGHVTLSAISTGAATPHVKAGKLRLLANTGAARLPAFPELPTLKELGYNAEVYLWTGIFVRKGVPDNVLKTLGSAVRQAVKDAEFVAASTKMQMLPDYLDAEAFKPWWDKDAEMLAAAIRSMPKPEPKK
jgi:tripartite-type tricarboxylate transporter receptor subunit TctC